MAHLLLIRLSAMGDVAMTVPVVRALARRRPTLRLTVLSREWARPLFEGLGPQVHFYAADLQRPDGRHRGMAGLRRLYHELRGLGVTHVADLHGVLRTHWLRARFRLGGCPTASIDKRRALRRALCEAGAEAYLKRHEALPSVFSAYEEVVERLERLLDDGTGPQGGGQAPQGGQLISGDGQGRQGVGPDRRGIGVAPFAAHAGKELPIETVERVLALLAKRRPEGRIVLFGRGRREEALFPEWRRRWPSQVEVAADTCRDVGDELLLMAGLEAMLSMDSANQHLASLVGTRVVTVWGQTHPAAGFMPWGQRAEDSVQLSMPCRPCSVYGNKRCRLEGVPAGTFPCLSGLQAEDIVDRLLMEVNVGDTENGLATT